MAEEGKSYISVAYNIGLILVMATTLGLLMGKITDLISYERQNLVSSDTTGKVDSE
ncbi:MAG: hypothetical protein JSU79_02735 [Dehalococcoidales bacterium]|nr:MAG: hypothetical protein JSU79_02735 [Dehalococcoidales bacterium]